MIKPIDEIPQNKMQKYENYRQKIRNDFAEAIDKGIYKFEFIGDYNYKTLTQTAREEANSLVRKIIHDWVLKHPEYKGKIYNMFGFTENKTLKLIVVSSIKGETPDKRRVFCEIQPNMEEIISEYADRKMAEYEQRRK